MTTPAPTSPPPAGMPKWLILLLVIFLVIVLGCCGGIATCHFMCSRVAETASSALRDAGERARAVAESEAARMAAQQAARAAQTGADAVAGAPAAGAGAGNPPVEGMPAGGAAAGGAAAAGGGDNPLAGLATTKMPANFPADIPIYSGLSPNYAQANLMQGNGSVMLTGEGDADKISEYYQKQLPAKGWTLSDNQTFNGISSLAFTKEPLKLNIVVSPQGKKVMLNIVYTKQ